MPADSEAPSPALDVAALTAVLDGRYAQVRNLVRENLAEHASILDDAEEMSQHDFRERVLEVVKLMADTGQTGFGFPKEYGGGADVGASIAAFETLSFGDLSVVVKVGVQFGLFGGAVLQLGSKPHHDAYLDDLIHGRLIGCFAMTESGHGSNVQALGTTATYDADAGEFVIDTPDERARKDYIGNAAMHASHAVVFAQLIVDGEARGVHALVVPIRTEKGKPAPGVRIEDCGRKIGLNGVDNGRLYFEGVRVPRTNLLDRYAVVTDDGRYFSEIENPDRRFFTMLGTLVQGRVCVGGAGINASKVALAIAIEYAHHRRQFGNPGSGEEEVLLDYGMHQRRLFPLLARTYALHFAQERVATDLHEVFSDISDEGAAELARRALESRAAGTKAMGTWHASHTIQECREACGGAGYLSVNRFDALRADTDVFTTFEGDNTILMQLVAKGLLTDYKDSFEDLDQIGLVRFVASTAVETVLERTNARSILERLREVVPGSGGGDDDGSDEGLEDSSYHLEMLSWREEHILSSVARRLKRGMDSGREPAEVFSLCQDHVISAANAHVERIVLEAFLDKIESVDEGPNRDALKLLCDVYALSAIEQDRGWFLEHGRLSNARAKAVTAKVNELNRRIRPIAQQLVDAFGIPREMLRAELLEFSAS
jgi:acyl-CoA oxidase